MPIGKRRSAGLIVAGLPSAVVAFASVALDTQGNIRAVADASFGDVEMEVFFFSAATLDTATFTGWVRQQVTLLQAAA